MSNFTTTNFAEITQQLLQHTNIGVWNSQSLKDGVVCNEPFRELHSISPENEMISWEEFLESIHPDYQYQFSQTILQNEQNQLELKFEFEYRPRIIKNEIQWLQCKGMVKFDNNQSMIEAYGAVQDISKQKSLEHQLETVKSLNQGFQQLSNFGSWRTDFNTNKIHWSDSVYEMFGVQKNEFVLTRETFMEKIHPEDQKHVKQAFVDAVMERRKYSIDHRIILPSGEIRWLREQADVVYSDNKELIEMIGTVQDITVLKEKDEKIERSEAFYSSLVENLPQCIFQKNLNGVFTFVDKNFCQLIDKTYDEIIGKTDFDLYPHDLAEKFHQDDRKVIASGEVLQLKEQNILPDGTTMTVQVLKSPVTDSSGSVIAIQGIFWDVTETVQLEEQLRQSQKMDAIGQLAGGVAHDFNNIIVVINMNSELALSRVERGTEIHNELTEINEAANRAASLTRQMLAFSRKQILDKSVIDVNDLIQNLEKMLKRLIGEDIHLNSCLDSTLPYIYADLSQIEQVILNLIVNSRDAMPNGGELVIETKRETITTPRLLAETQIVPGEYVTISVRDRGIGIAKEHLSRVFEPFFTTKAEGKGTGLGLSTVYGIVKQSEGYIEVNSAVDFGTEFNIYLPAHHTGQSTEMSVIRDFVSNTSNARILLVEDEEIVRKSLISILENKNFQVKSASDGYEALEIIHNQFDPIDLMISDLIMPGMNGIELSQKLYAFNPMIKTLLISGYSGTIYKNHNLKEENFNFLQKPFTPDELIKKIDSILSS